MDCEVGGGPVGRGGHKGGDPRSAVVVQHFFVYRQKTAYEVLRSLVGSEMCIRDSVYPAAGRSQFMTRG